MGVSRRTEDSYSRLLFLTLYVPHQFTCPIKNGTYKHVGTSRMYTSNSAVGLVHCPRRWRTRILPSPCLLIFHPFSLWRSETMLLLLPKSPRKRAFGHTPPIRKKKRGHNRDYQKRLRNKLISCKVKPLHAFTCTETYSMGIVRGVSSSWGLVDRRCWRGMVFTCGTKWPGEGGKGEALVQRIIPFMTRCEDW